MTKPHTTLSEAVRALPSIAPEAYDKWEAASYHAAYKAGLAAAADLVEQHEAQEPVELVGVQEQMKEGAGFWHSCSGCHETEDGHPVGSYPYSDVFKCALGNGCSECGGIGAVWDNTDYDAMAVGLESDSAQPTLAATQAGDAKKPMTKEQRQEAAKHTDWCMHCGQGWDCSEREQAARVDAARYRFLRKGFGDMGPDVDVHNAFVDGNEKMDAAIDAAMSPTTTRSE